MFAANYPFLSVCLNEVFFCKCLGFKKPIRVDKALKHCNSGHWGHLVSLPGQVSLAELCGKQQVVSFNTFTQFIVVPKLKKNTFNRGAFAAAVKTTTSYKSFLFYST